MTASNKCWIYIGYKLEIQYVYSMLKYYVHAWAGKNRAILAHIHGYNFGLMQAINFLAPHLWIWIIHRLDR